MNGLSPSGLASAASATLLGERAGYGVGALGVVQVPQAQVSGLRRTLGPPGERPFAPTFLKPSEDQTVVAVAAVLRAMQDFNLPRSALTGWGVIAAPRSLARLESVDQLKKFDQGGAWKVSPLLAPHHSLHSLSGTISLGLGIRGFNFGVGGGPGALVEGLLAALATLEERRWPGLWLVLAEADPEPIPDENGVSLVPVVYNAVALGFVPVAADWHGLRLRLLDSEPGARPRRRARRRALAS